MKLKRSRVTGQVDRNAVIGFDVEAASAKATHPRYLHLLGRERNIVVAGLLNHGVANVIFRAGAVRCLKGFGLDRILELVVCEVWRNYLQPHQRQRGEKGEAKD